MAFDVIVGRTRERATRWGLANGQRADLVMSYSESPHRVRGCRIDRIFFLDDPTKDEWDAIWPALAPAMMGAEVFYVR